MGHSEQNIPVHKMTQFLTVYGKKMHENTCVRCCENWRLWGLYVRGSVSLALISGKFTTKRNTAAATEQ